MTSTCIMFTQRQKSVRLITFLALYWFRYHRFILVPLGRYLASIYDYINRQIRQA